MTIPEYLKNLSNGARISPAPCQQCGKYFIYYPAKLPGDGTPPKRCPRCIDQRQGRPSVVEERHEVAVYGPVEVVNLPGSGSWKEFHTGRDGDAVSYQIDVKGQTFGADWNGRIVMHAQRPIAPGESVLVREMEVLHRVRVVHELRKTLHHGEVSVERTLPVTSNEGEEVVQQRRYLVLEPVVPTEPGDLQGKLVWATARTKTTLKGSSQQYWAEVRGAPIARWQIRGGVRSGRENTVGVLAIVDEEHPLLVVTEGDYQKEVTFK